MSQWQFFIHILQETRRHKVIVAAAFIIAIFGTYDTANGDFLGGLLPPSSRIVVMIGHFLPWWGWLFLSATVFSYAFFYEAYRAAKKGHPYTSTQPKSDTFLPAPFSAVILVIMFFLFGWIFLLYRINGIASGPSESKVRQIVNTELDARLSRNHVNSTDTGLSVIAQTYWFVKRHTEFVGLENVYNKSCERLLSFYTDVKPTGGIPPHGINNKTGEKIEDMGYEPVILQRHLTSAEQAISKQIQQDFHAEINLHRHPNFSENQNAHVPGDSSIQNAFTKTEYHRLYDECQTAKQTLRSYQEKYEDKIALAERAVKVLATDTTH